MKNLKVLALPVMMVAALTACGKSGYQSVTREAFVAEVAKLQVGLVIYERIDATFTGVLDGETVSESCYITLDIETGTPTGHDGDEDLFEEVPDILGMFPLTGLDFTEEMPGMSYFLPFHITYSPAETVNMTYSWNSVGALTEYSTVVNDGEGTNTMSYKFTYTGNYNVLPFEEE